MLLKNREKDLTILNTMIREDSSVEVAHESKTEWSWGAIAGEEMAWDKNEWNKII